MTSAEPVTSAEQGDPVGPVASGGPAGAVAWVDASAGVAGDMLLAALVDAGAELDPIQAAVDAVVPGGVRLRHSSVLRAGLRAAKVDVDLLIEGPEHRDWASIRARIDAAALPDPVRHSAQEVFARLADAEGRVHGIPPDRVRFHEVGGLDAIADVVGVCTALHRLGVTGLRVGPIAVGSGQVDTAHGLLPVPVPAVLDLLRGWPVTGGGRGELATPTGVALLTALGTASALVPDGVLAGTGVGAGSRDTPGRPNVVRVLLCRPADRPCGEPDGQDQGRDQGRDQQVRAVVLAANVDDLDPRLWPGVLQALLDAGADDAWLVPILMKKGRPGHLLNVLGSPDVVPALRRIVFERTSTIGVRQHAVHKTALNRTWVPVQVAGGTVAVKIAHRDGRILSATPEFADVAELARGTGLGERAVLARAVAAAESAGLSPGGCWPR